MTRGSLSVVALLAMALQAGCGTVRRAEGEDPGLPDGSPDGDGSAGEPGGIDSGPGDSDGGPDASGRRIAYVDAAGGDDANDGATPANPFRTITRALGSAVSGDVVQLGPGTYDAALGEVFPLVVPEGVILRGAEASKGAGVVIAGSGAAIGNTIDPRSGSVLAGLTVRSAAAKQSTVVLDIVSPEVTVENCTVSDEPFSGINVRGGTGHVVRGNLLVRNDVGIVMLDAVGVRVEGNVIRDNATGVRHGSLGADLGGGPTGSAGGNVIACNVQSDLQTYLDTSASIPAAGNAWDHVPPSSDDIDNPNGAAIDLTGATMAPDACP